MPLCAPAPPPTAPLRVLAGGMRSMEKQQQQQLRKFYELQDSEVFRKLLHSAVISRPTYRSHSFLISHTHTSFSLSLFFSLSTTVSLSPRFFLSLVVSVPCEVSLPPKHTVHMAVLPLPLHL